MIFNYKIEKLSVICGVYGPMEVKFKDEKLEKATIQVEFKPLAGRGGEHLCCFSLDEDSY